VKKSIATVCLSGDLRQKMEAASAAGFTGVEIFENDLMLFNESPAAVRRMAEDLNLEIIALQPFRDFECMPSQLRAKNFDRAKRKFDLMDELGTESLLICSNVSRHCIEDKQKAIEDLTDLAELAKSRGFNIGYEALAWGRWVRDYEEAWDIVKRADHPNLGIILDSFHIFARSKDLSTLAEIPGEKITLVQIADAPWLSMDSLQWSRHFRCFPGQGQFPLVDFVSQIYRTGYRGYISHEIFNDEFRAASGRAMAVDGMRSLKWLEEQLAIEVPELVEGLGENTPDLAVPQLEQVEFVEFAVDAAGREDLLQLLIKLGFGLTHKHKSKDVKLYRLGEVSILVNEEPDSLAQHYSNLHGTSVCAVGYLTKSAQGMVDRANYFNYPLFESRAERGELNIPGLKGVGGELIYFVQHQPDNLRFFDIDFDRIQPDVDQSSPEKTDLKVDHLASSLSEAEFLSTSLLYRILFGFEFMQPQDLIDPFGLVVSRTAASKNKKIRLPFNMTRSTAALAEKFRQDHKGSGIHQIALRTDDILSFREKVDDSIILPIPNNYYDDIEARFDISPELLSRIRKANILYDENETGQFLHFYTLSVNGIYFEIVQRDQYAGYGEANAQVRLAAQARLAKG